MTAPEIPNLRTLLGSRGRGGRGGIPPLVPPRRPRPEDIIIQETDHDARTSHLSAVEAGYLDDPFARAFVMESVSRRVPIMNRGTYLRLQAIDTLVKSFLSSYAHPSSSNPTCQIISLGAGSDTRFFRLSQMFRGSTSSSNSSPTLPFAYHEFDMYPNTAKKINTIANKSPDLLKPCIPGPIEIDRKGDKLRSSNYCIYPYDLRNFRALYCGEPALPHPILAGPYGPHGINPDLPTLIISECCFCYLLPIVTHNVLDFFKSLFLPEIPLSIVIYEPVNPFDPFGKMMEQNLASRGITLHGLKEWHSLEKQRERLFTFFSTSGGSSHRHSVTEHLEGPVEEWGAQAVDINEIWQSWISEEEKERVKALEMVDEVEEWELLAGHYCVAWGWRGGQEGDWRTWKELGGEGKGG